MADSKKRKFVHVAISDPDVAEHLEAACEVYRESANRYMGRLLRADMERRGDDVRKARDQMREADAMREELLTGKSLREKFAAREKRAALRERTAGPQGQGEKDAEE